MKKETRKRLEEAGWRVGTTRQFLELDDVENELVEMKLALAERVRSVRLSAGLTQLDLAKRIGSSQSRVARIEAADRSVSMDLLVRTLLAAGGDRREVARAMASRKR
jgi:ribosome-binding protein aMBF1 (putative translation factor)